MEDSTATGRLFRSLHAQGDLAGDAIIALDLEDAIRLRSVHLVDHAPDALSNPDSPVGLEPRTDADPDPEVDVALAVVSDVSVDPDFAHLFADEPRHPEHLDTPAAGGVATGAPDSTTDARRSRVAGRDANLELTSGIPAWVAVSMVAGVTVLIGIADVIVTGQIGWLTGIALLLVSIYAASSVRPQDGYWAIVTPPLAFLLTTITVGQATVTGGGFWVRQGLLIPFTLGRAALWIVAATSAAALIVVVRRRRALGR